MINIQAKIPQLDNKMQILIRIFHLYRIYFIK
jgi:hypothetical protein